jgi:phosphoribosylaminoimidazole carboxylase PurE protein
MMAKVVILLGSKTDEEFARPIVERLEEAGVRFEVHVASAHRSPERLLQVVRSYEREKAVVFVTVAGRSNALSGMVDAHTTHPVIACPNLKGEFAPFDLFSSLRMPSGVAPLVVLDPQNAALAALKILSLSEDELVQRVNRLQASFKQT